MTYPYGEDRKSSQRSRVESVLGYAKGGSVPSVARIQAKLKADGYNPGPVDGIMGKRTRAALKASGKSSPDQSLRGARVKGPGVYAKSGYKMDPSVAYKEVYGKDPTVEPEGGWKRNSGPGIADPGAFKAYEKITGKKYVGPRTEAGIMKAFKAAGIDGETWEPLP